MHVIKTSIYECNAELFYNNLKKTSSLVHVARPIIYFKQLPQYPLPEIWREGRYQVSMRIFGFIPFGRQWIVVTTNDENMYVRDNGYSRLVKKWDHHIYVNATDDDRTIYTDIVQIKAGLLTPIIYLFAVCFYAHRQKRWKKLVSNNLNYNEVCCN